MRIKAICILAVSVLLMSLSGCGIFHKDCGCPHFGMIKAPSTGRVAKLA